MKHEFQITYISDENRYTITTINAIDIDNALLLFKRIYKYKIILLIQFNESVQ